MPIAPLFPCSRDQLMSSLVESIFGRSAAPRQIAIVGVGVIVTAAVFGVSQWAVEPQLMPLFANVPIASVGAMTDKLTELNIKYELDRNGNTIRVNETDIARARVALAREGLPNAGRPGMELFDKPTWGMTDFTQKVNYGRALEGELERTIGNMRDVDQVQVHLALEDDALFKKNERPSKASVTLTMKGGEAPQQSVVRGIASLVAGSIGGLEPQHVTIVDERGHALTSNDDGTVAGLTSRQLTVQREVETSLERKAEELLNKFVGAGNSRVQVTASINFDKLERTTQSVDPEKQATTSEQKAEVTPGKPEQGAGYNTTATSYENSRSVENYTGAIGNIKKLTVAVLVADKVTIAARDTAVKVAPKPVITMRTAEELAKIETLVRNGLGVDSARGDLLSVVNTTFDEPVMILKHDTLATPSLIAKLQTNPKPVIGVGALVVMLVMAFVMIGALKPPRPTKAQQLQLQSPGYGESASAPATASLQHSPADMYAALESPRQIVLPAMETSNERQQAIATVNQRPDAAVRVTKNWVRG